MSNNDDMRVRKNISKQVFATMAATSLLLLLEIDEPLSSVSHLIAFYGFTVSLVVNASMFLIMELILWAKQETNNSFAMGSETVYKTKFEKWMGTFGIKILLLISLGSFMASFYTWLSINGIAIFNFIVMLILVSVVYFFSFVSKITERFVKEFKSKE
jgi:hypothetical protein